MARKTWLWKGPWPNAAAIGKGREHRDQLKNYILAHEGSLNLVILTKEAECKDVGRSRWNSKSTVKANPPCKTWRKRMTFSVANFNIVADVKQ